MSLSARHAVVRFGLGPRPDQPLPSDPAAWLLGQVRPRPPLPGPETADVAAALRVRPSENGPNPQERLARMERLTLARTLLLSPDGFAERWAMLWANHLCVSRRGGGFANNLADHHWRTVIRPQAFGRFEDLLLGTVAHPAMLSYLDNFNSVAPNSLAGRRTPGRGVTENLARELLELHTVGIDAGYTQADVEALALLLSGWSIGRGPEADEPEGFMFRPSAHEPGPKTLLGRSFPEGEAGGKLALRFLANHPATYRRLARRIATHFIADDPPAEDVAALERALAGSGGDLGAAARALVALPSSWRPLVKPCSAQDYVIALLRLMGADETAGPMLIQTMERLGQAPFAPPTPRGWPEGGAWANPEQAMRRLDWASELASMLSFAAPREPAEMLELARGGLIPEARLREVAAANSARDAYLLALAAPWMHRR